MRTTVAQRLALAFSFVLAKLRDRDGVENGEGDEDASVFLPFVIVLYALIRDADGAQFGDVSVVDISCLHLPFVGQYLKAKREGQINEAYEERERERERSFSHWRQLLSERGCGQSKSRSIQRLQWQV